MFGLSFIELAFFALVVLLVIDANDIPKFARTLQNWINKFAEFKYEIVNSLDDVTKELNIKEALKAVEEEKKLMEEELQSIVKELPETTSANDIVKLNQKNNKKEEKGNV